MPLFIMIGIGAILALIMYAGIFILAIAAVGLLAFGILGRTAQFVAWLYKTLVNPCPAAPGNTPNLTFDGGTEMGIDMPVRIEIDRLLAEVSDDWLRQFDDLSLPAREVDSAEIERLISATDSEYARGILRDLAKFH